MALSGCCHCKSNAFEISGMLPDKLTRCTCSFCAKRGHLFAYFEPQQFRMIKEASDSIYRWQTKTVAHHFCSACGCSLYSDSPAFEGDGTWDGKTRRIGVNARLLDDFEAAEWPAEVIDGKNLW